MSIKDKGTIELTVLPPKLHQRLNKRRSCHSQRDIVRLLRLALPKILQSVLRSPCMYRVPSTLDFLQQGQSCYCALSTYMFK